MTREQLELENAKLRRVVRAAVRLRDAETVVAVNEALTDFNWELGSVVGPKVPGTKHEH